MMLRRAASALLVLTAFGCGGSGSNGSGGAPKLDDADFTRPWVLQDRVASGKPIDAIARGPAGFVAITHAPTLDGKGMPARNNLAAVSVDGLNWSEAPIDPDGHYWSISYGAGRYVAVGGMASGGGPGRIISSSDGRAWIEVATTSQVLRRVRSTPAGFIAVGIQGAIVTSTDGSIWTETEGTRGMLWDANYGVGVFVAVGLTLAVGAPNAQQWVAVPCGPTLPCNNVVDPSGVNHGILQLDTVDVGNGAFVTQGVAGLLRSHDGLAWTNVGEAHRQLAFADGRFIAIDATNPQADATDPASRSFRIFDSVDGQTWQQRTTAMAAADNTTCATAHCLLLPAALLMIPPRP
jgi:hypothetical protein